MSKSGYPSIDKPWLKYYNNEAIETPLPECTMYEAIHKANEDNLDKIALDFYGNYVTYKELFVKIRNVAAALTALSVKKGDVVTICMLNTPETIYLFYALNMIGAVANILCPVSPLNELLHDINMCDSTLLFTLDIFMNNIMSIIDKTKINTVVVADVNGTIIEASSANNGLSNNSTKCDINDNRFMNWATFMKNKNDSFIINSNHNDVAVILYTGGTTGGSKGVALTNYGIVSHGWQFIHGCSELNRSDTWAEVLPLFISYGVSCSLQMPLMVGMTIMLRLPMSDTLEELIRLKPTHIMSVPNAWNNISETNPDIDLSFMIEPITGGDTLPETIEAKVNAYLRKHNCVYPLMNGYGMSEVCASGAVNSKKAYKAGTVGIPFVKNIISAFDTETHKELKYGEEGELCICSPSIMKEYINNPEETRNVIKLHEDGKLWVHTGDLGFVDSDGFVHLRGRLKRYFVKYWKEGVKKVFCPDAERSMIKCPEIENCVIVPTHKGTVQFAHAFIIPTNKSVDPDITMKAVISFCEKELGEVYRPDDYTIVDSFPRTKVGKIDYRALERRAELEYSSERF